MFHAALPLRQFLSLPPSLRCYLQKTSSQMAASLQRENGYISASRHVSQSARSSRQARPAKTAPPLGGPRKAANPPPVPPPPSPREPPRKIPYTSPATTPQGSPYARTLLGQADQILLYHAPSHTSFFICSYLFGAFMTLGAMTTMAGAREDQGDPRIKVTWWARIPVMTLGIVFAGFGCAFFLAPLKMIKTVSLLSATQRGAQQCLQIESKPFFRPLPFGAKTMTIPLTDVFINRAVAATDVRFGSVTLKDGVAFTQHYATQHQRPKAPLSARFRHFNKALLTFFPALLRDIRRMFFRDGMAYIRIEGHGNWKLDLQGAELLDDGRPLEKLVQVEREATRGLPGLVGRAREILR